MKTQQEPACTDSANNPVFCNPSIAALQTTDDRIFTTIVTPRTEQVAHNYTLTISVRAGGVTSVVGNKPNEAAALEVPYSATGGDGADLLDRSEGELRQRPGDAEMEYSGEQRWRCDRPL